MKNGFPFLFLDAPEVFDGERCHNVLCLNSSAQNAAHVSCTESVGMDDPLFTFLADAVQCTSRWYSVQNMNSKSAAPERPFR